MCKGRYRLNDFALSSGGYGQVFLIEEVRNNPSSWLNKALKGTANMRTKTKSKELVCPEVPEGEKSSSESDSDDDVGGTKGTSSAGSAGPNSKELNLEFIAGDTGGESVLPIEEQKRREKNQRNKDRRNQGRKGGNRMAIKKKTKFNIDGVLSAPVSSGEDKEKGIAGWIFILVCIL